MVTLNDVWDWTKKIGGWGSAAYVVGYVALKAFVAMTAGEYNTVIFSNMGEKLAFDENFTRGHYTRRRLSGRTDKVYFAVKPPANDARNIQPSNLEVTAITTDPSWKPLDQETHEKGDSNAATMYCNGAQEALRERWNATLGTKVAKHVKPRL